MKKLSSIFVLSLCLAKVAPAAVVTFTGGTITFNNAGGTAITAGDQNYSDVDFYTENGFVLDYIGGSGFSSNVGNYYGTGNDVIHGHWAWESLRLIFTKTAVEVLISITLF